jgi:AraC-like DNA-binding protein
MRFVDKPRGLLYPNAKDSIYQLSRYLSSPDIGRFVERYWLAEWEVDAPYLQEHIPYPCVNIVFEDQDAGIYGVAERKSSRWLVGKGRAFGMKFKPGGFYPFYGSPVSAFTGRRLEVEAVFGGAGAELAKIIPPLPDVNAMIACTEGFLREYLPQPDQTVEEINRMIDCIIQDRTIAKVDDLTERFNIGKRTLQRLFSLYVGVSPKWVIQRYRLHEAAEQLTAGTSVDLTQLALHLGYFDQAHFIKDFKAMVGKSPGEYAMMVQSGVNMDER